MSRRSTIPPAASRFEFVPANYFTPVDLQTVFGRTAELEVDLGCGDGAFLVARAKAFPERNFLGIERMAGRVRAACNRAFRLGLENVRTLRVEASYALTYLLPSASVSVVHLLFPDPWPKRRHARRRLVTSAFCAAVQVVLRDEGLLNIATDEPSYFTGIRDAFLATGGFSLVEPGDNVATEPSTFERQFAATGVAIYRIVLRKTVPSR